ncbi:MAG: hypothetical protein LJE60_14815 [Thiocapsa sp.]|nr:RT0821/Lpp0805 family surface protein [Thiocapsa sp.]MCG6898359.1 hypothetical protein [Thiocapsa sp.]
MKTLLTAGAMLAVLGATPAHAVNLRWLEYSPVRYFSDEDWELARAAADDALQNRPDGEAVEWHNPKTGYSGRSTPIRSLERGGKPCRELELENRARSMSGRSVFLFCLQPTNEWKTEAPDAPDASDRPAK